MILNPSTPSGYTLFCDDIRREFNGKLTLVGTYTGMMFIVGEAPVILPRLSLLVTYQEEPGESDAAVEVRVFSPGDDDEAPCFKQIIREAGTRPDGGESRPLAGSKQLQIVRSVIEIAPFVVQQEGHVRVRAYRGADEIRLGTMMISFVQPPTETTVVTPAV